MTVLKRSFVGRCFPHSSGEVGLGVGAIARPHPINDPDHPRVSGENDCTNELDKRTLGSSPREQGKLLDLRLYYVKRLDFGD